MKQGDVCDKDIQDHRWYAFWFRRRASILCEDRSLSCLLIAYVAPLCNLRSNPEKACVRVDFTL
jgi:hypothetical protein